MASNTRTNPKRAIAEAYSNQGLAEEMFEYIASPIAREIKDIEEYINHSYKLYPYIPFFGQGDGMLYFLQRLRMLSPTHSGIIERIQDFTIGDELKVVSRSNKRLGFITVNEEQEVSNTEFNGYVDNLESLGLTGEKLLQTAEAMYENYMTYGNIFYEMVLAETDGQVAVDFHVYDCEHVRYLATDKDSARVCLVSAKFTETYLRKNPPTFLPLFPNFVEDEFGSKRCMFHVTNKIAGFQWYGVPRWSGGIFFAYNELQQGQYQTQGYANDWIGKLLIEFEANLDDDAPEDVAVSDDGLDQGERSFVQSMEQTFTNKGTGRKRSVLWRRRGPGVAPAFVHEFKTETNHEFHTANAELAESQLFKAHGWHPALMVSISGKLGGTSEIPELATYMRETTVKRIRKILLRALNKPLAYVAEMYKPEMLPYALSIKEPLFGAKTSTEGGEDQPETAQELAQANLRGSVGGVQGILGLQSSVSQGITQYDAAVELLKEIYGFAEETAKKVLGEPIDRTDGNEDTIDGDE